MSAPNSPDLLHDVLLMVLGAVAAALGKWWSDSRSDASGRRQKRDDAHISWLNTQGVLLSRIGALAAHFSNTHKSEIDIDHARGVTEKLQEEVQGMTAALNAAYLFETRNTQRAALQLQSKLVTCIAKRLSNFVELQVSLVELAASKAEMESHITSSKQLLDAAETAGDAERIRLSRELHENATDNLRRLESHTSSGFDNTARIASEMLVDVEAAQSNLEQIRELLSN